MGSKSSPELIRSFLLSAALCLAAALRQKSIYYPSEKMNWTEARLHCQRSHADLIIWNRVNGSQLAEWLLTNNVKQVWIDKHGDPEKDRTDVKGGREDCGYFDAVTKKQRSKVCSAELRFVCYDHGLVVVNENKTWEEALRHCRTMTTPCAASSGACVHRHSILGNRSLRGDSHVREQISRAATDEVWVGLRFLGGKWYWMNGREVDNREMLPECPSRWNYCGAVSKHNTSNPITKDCSERRNFICYRREKKIIEDYENSSVTV